MKQVKLTITENYVSHWSWWQGLRELIQNAVDTQKYDVTIGAGWVKITSHGGTVPIEALLLGHTTKTDDESTIGKFGEGLKLGFLVLSRLGADIQMCNGKDLWVPEMVHDDTFGTKVLAVNIIEGGVIPPTDSVSITVGNIPAEAIEELKSKFAPLQDLEVVIENRKGKAYKKESWGSPCRLFVNGIFVTEVKGHFKFDYDFVPSAFVLDRDRDSASDFEVKWEAAKLISESPDIEMLAQLASEDFDDLSEFSGRFEDYRRGKRQSYYEEDEPQEMTLQQKAAELFIEKHGDNAYPINYSWPDTKKRLVTDLAIKKGYSPVVVKNTLCQMLDEVFNLDREAQQMLNFKPLEWLERFEAKHGRKLYSKAKKDLARTIEMLRIVASK